MAVLYHTTVKIRKNALNGQRKNFKNAWNRQRTENREQRIQLQRPLLSPVDRRGERANYLALIPVYVLHCFV